jgi:hypothetical protein
LRDSVAAILLGATLRKMEKSGSNRYRIVLACDDVPADRAMQTASDVAEEFTHRPWHENVECKWSDGSLLLSAEDDHDPQGLALMYEFSDAISA